MAATLNRSKETIKKEHSFSILYRNKCSIFNKNSKVFRIIPMNSVEFIIKKEILYIPKERYWDNENKKLWENVLQSKISEWNNQQNLP